MSGNNSELVKLKIQGYKDAGYSEKIGTAPFTVMFNPTTISQEHSINYNNTQAPNTSKAENTFDKTNPESVSLELMLDGTGAAGGATVEVKDYLKRLKEHVYNFIGDEHETPFAILNWGNWFFDGRLKSLNITYTMFKPDGDPLRAKVALSFIGAMDKDSEAKKRSLSSPDLSHLVTVYEGDTLPLMCKRVYGDSSMYLNVAQVNDLVNFRYLEPGTELLFPPIK